MGTSQMAGTEMLRIADFNMMEVLVDVNENDIIRITKGDTADIDVDAYPGRRFKGVVTQIANSAKNLTAATSALTDVTNFEVRIRLLPASYADLLEKDPIPFRPGMSASVEIETDRQDNALTVPLQAVIQSIENIQITGGLEDADSTWIVTGPYSTVNRVLEDGMKVNADIEKHNDDER